jgi:hypothetical protein
VSSVTSTTGTINAHPTPSPISAPVLSSEGGAADPGAASTVGPVQWNDDFDVVAPVGEML